jgi:hypothetical protein
MGVETDLFLMKQNEWQVFENKMFGERMKLKTKEMGSVGYVGIGQHSNVSYRNML